MKQRVPFLAFSSGGMLSNESPFFRTNLVIYYVLLNTSFQIIFCFVVVLCRVYISTHNTRSFLLPCSTHFSRRPHMTSRVVMVVYCDAENSNKSFLTMSINYCLLLKAVMNHLLACPPIVCLTYPPSPQASQHPRQEKQSQLAITTVYHQKSLFCQSAPLSD